MSCEKVGKTAAKIFAGSICPNPLKRGLLCLIDPQHATAAAALDVSRFYKVRYTQPVVAFLLPSPATAGLLFFLKGGGEVKARFCNFLTFEVSSQL